jgi:peptide/nickel transport system permease protein
MPMIALIGSEAPGRIEWSLKAGAHAQLLKPVGDSGAYSALLIARDTFDAQKALSAEIADLRGGWKMALFGLAIIALVVSGAVFAPLIAPFDPNEQMFDGLTLEGAPMPPGGPFLMGTDLLWAATCSAGCSTARDLADHRGGGQRLALVIGTLVGITAGYLPRLDRRHPDALHRPDDGLSGAAARHLPGGDLPALAVDRGAGHRAGELGADGARDLYRDLVAGEREFIAAERTLGASTSRILFRHILPHLLPTIIVWGTLGISTTVLLEATLSFLGIGVQPPTPSWGNIIFENQTYFQAAPWLVFIPGRGDHPAGAWPSTWSAMRCATCWTRRSGGATDGGLSDPPPGPVRADPARRQLHHLRPAVSSCPPTRCARSPGAADGADGREHPPAAGPRPAASWCNTALSGRLVQGDLGRSYLQKTEVAELIAARLPATLLLMVGGDCLRTGARPDDGHHRRAVARQGGGPDADDRRPSSPSRRRNSWSACCCSTSSR